MVIASSSAKTKAKKVNLKVPRIDRPPLTLSLDQLHSEAHIKWLDSGKPVLESSELEGIEVSLTHDEQTCLCVAGYGSQGCDLTPIGDRTLEDWIALLSYKREPLLRQLLTQVSDSPASAGSRIWAALEALRKATNAQELELEMNRQEGDSVLFCGIGNGQQVHILTFPLALTRGLRRMVAVVVNLVKEEIPQPALRNLYQMTPDKTFVVRWPISYQETANPSQSLYFSHFFNWMGKVRDLSVWSIREPLGQYLASGQWGMVTNFAQTRILGTAGMNDLIECRFGVSNRSGATQSTVDFYYDWQKVLPNGQCERIALSQLQMTWVQFSDKGAQPRPLPDFLEKVMQQLYHSEVSLLPKTPVDLGAEIYRATHSPSGRNLLQEQTFLTTLEDTDVIGNINFASYAILQGRIRDSFLYGLMPESYHRGSNSGEFRCVSSRIEYLREALPFETIQVSLSLQAIYEKGLILQVEYFRLTPNAEKQKLAVGEHQVAWLMGGQQGTFVPTALPKSVLTTLL